MMKVLFVDDDQMMQRMFGRALEQAGYALVTASDGTEVQAAAANEHPDVILMDVMMPKLNGIDALEILKGSDQTKDIPVIMLSAYDDPELMQQAMDAGAVRYLAKNAVEPDQVAAIAQQTYNETSAKQSNN